MIFPDLPKAPKDIDIECKWIPEDTRTAKSLDVLHCMIDVGMFTIKPTKTWKRFLFKSYQVRFEPNLVSHLNDDEYFREKQRYYTSPVVDTNHITTIFEAKLIVELLVKSAALYFYAKEINHLLDSAKKFNTLLNKETT